MNLKNYEENMIKWRRHLHANPELPFQEYETSKYIEAELRAYGIDNIVKPTETSVVARIKGGKPGPIMGFRADIDALALCEERPDLDFASTVDGVMHACGHDAHAAMLMAAGQYLFDHKDEIEGEVVLVFQHAEELPPGGAIEIIESGALDDLDFMFGQHVQSKHPVGKVGIYKERSSANSDRYEIRINGKGAHASTPQDSADPVLIGAIIVQNLQNIVSRKMNPVHGRVISNTIFHAGSESYNVIPDFAELAGSVRTFYDEDKELIRREIERTVKAVCDLYGATYEYQYNFGYVSIIQDEKATNAVEEIIKNMGDQEIIYPETGMGGEDFAFYSRKIPSVFIETGTSSEGFDHPHHNPKFGVDEEGMKNGLRIAIEVAKNYPKYFK